MRWGGGRFGVVKYRYIRWWKKFIQAIFIANIASQINIQSLFNYLTYFFEMLLIPTDFNPRSLREPPIYGGHTVHPHAIHFNCVRCWCIYQEKQNENWDFLRNSRVDPGRCRSLQPRHQETNDEYRCLGNNRECGRYRERYDHTTHHMKTIRKAGAHLRPGFPFSKVVTNLLTLLFILSNSSSRHHEIVWVFLWCSCLLTFTCWLTP